MIPLSPLSCSPIWGAVVVGKVSRPTVTHITLTEYFHFPPVSSQISVETFNTVPLSCCCCCCCVCVLLVLLWHLHTHRKCRGVSRQAEMHKNWKALGLSKETPWSVWGEHKRNKPCLSLNSKQNTSDCSRNNRAHRAQTQGHTYYICSCVKSASMPV